MLVVFCARNVTKPNFFGTTNASSSAIPKVSNTHETLIDCNEIPPQPSAGKAKNEAIKMAVNKAIVNADGSVVFTFRNGVEIKQKP